METLLGLFAGSGSGAILGTFGSIVGGVFKSLNAKNELRARKQELDAEFRLQELQIKCKQEETEQEIALVDAETSREGLAASLHVAAAEARNAPPWVAVIKSLFRPLLTIILIAMTAWILRLLTSGSLSDFITGQEAGELVQYVVESVVFTTSTAVAWWFGDRAIARKTEK